LAQALRSAGSSAYKRRTVSQWKELSPTYKNVDLMVLAVADSIAAAIDDILNHARAEGERPSRVPLGFLAERVEQRGGHTYTRFYGQPSSWMSQFAPAGKLVKRVNRYDAANNVVGAAYARGE
jgi:hypothetical protein